MIACSCVRVGRGPKRSNELGASVVVAAAGTAELRADRRSRKRATMLVLRRRATDRLFRTHHTPDRITATSLVAKRFAQRVDPKKSGQTSPLRGEWPRTCCASTRTKEVRHAL